ncbi:MAG: transcription antitermination factor NusB [Candidatus Parcubacteria bacterium]|nr:transcription antitermination factor NusB [Candidatus Parcubacteria bacterium]
MASRHLSRSIALQTLYEWDFWQQDKSKILEILARNVNNYGPGIDDPEFPKKLVLGVIEHLDELNNIIIQSAPEWPLEQINLIDRNILRLGLFELMFMPKQEVPAKVAINESIELGKSFGGESSGRFINGVLGTIYRQLEKIEGQTEENNKI